jgi:hypothetical protein
MDGSRLLDRTGLDKDGLMDGITSEYDGSMEYSKIHCDILFFLRV